MNKIALILIIILLFSCKEEKKSVNIISREVNDRIKISETDNTNYKQSDTLLIPKKNEIIKPPPIPIVEPYTNKPIGCFNPNLDIDSAIELINSGIDDTQWFVVEDRKVSNLKTKLDSSDTILIQKELLKLKWKLIDSIQTNIGNQNKISIKMQKENRICSIYKILYLSKNNKPNSIEEGFEIERSN